MLSFQKLQSYLPSNVRFENKYTKRSSNTLLRLIYLFNWNGRYYTSTPNSFDISFDENVIKCRF